MFKDETKTFVTSRPLSSAFIFFSLVLFFISFSDSIMSYATPIFLDKQFNSTFIMGLVFSFSSIVGFVFDFYIGHRLKSKKFAFFIWSTAFFSFLFPLTFILLPKHLLTSLLALGIWGLCYELIAFTRFNLIKEKVVAKDFSKAWGITLNLSAVAYLVGPLIGSYLVSRSLNLSFYASLVLFGIAIVLLFIFSIIFKFSRREIISNDIQKRSLREVLLVWKALFRKTWILWFYSFVIVLVDSLFWSIGILYAEELKLKHSFGELFILAYMLPSTIMGFLLPVLAERLGKKKTAFIAGGLGGIMLFIFAFVNNIYLLIGTIFLSSILMAIAYPAMAAIFEDYIKRLGLFGNDMIGLQQTAGSLAYMIGPVVFGAIAAVVGTHKSFAFAGMLLTSTAIASLVIIPRKIKMPQKALEEICSIA